MKAETTSYLALAIALISILLTYYLWKKDKSILKEQQKSKSDLTNSDMYILAVDLESIENDLDTLIKEKKIDKKELEAFEISKEIRANQKEIRKNQSIQLRKELSLKDLIKIDTRLNISIKELKYTIVELKYLKEKWSKNKNIEPKYFKGKVSI